MRGPSPRVRHGRLSTRAALVVAALGLAVGAAFAACTLNPQPLPPGDGFEGQATGDYDASTRADSGGFTGPETPPAPPSDAGANGDGDSGGDAGDGDAGDGGGDAGIGDAAPDAG